MLRTCPEIIRPFLCGPKKKIHNLFCNISLAKNQEIYRQGSVGTQENRFGDFKRVHCIGILENSYEIPMPPLEKNPQKSIIIRTQGPKRRKIMMKFCGVSGGMSSAFACIFEVPYTVHPLKKCLAPFECCQPPRPSTEARTRKSGKCCFGYCLCCYFF